MEYIYATLTLNELEQELNQENITQVLEAAGADVIESRVKAIVAALEDVDIESLGLESGMLETEISPPVVTGENADIGSTDVDTDPAGSPPHEATPDAAFEADLFDEEEPDTEDTETTASTADESEASADSSGADTDVHAVDETVKESEAEGVDREETSSIDREEA